MAKKAHIRYSEGQWFAVPLRTSGYALGIVVRGNYRTKGGLGYFFGPKIMEIPGDDATWHKNAGEAVLITQFGDLGIINGRWPLIKSTRDFSREEWPIPKFGMEISLMIGKGFVREYEQNDIGYLVLIHQSIVDVKDIASLPEDGISGGGAVEIKLTRLLDNF